MEKLNFPAFDFLYREEGTELYIYDLVRRRYVFLSPEEWVRQHVVRYLIDYKKYPKTLIQIEGTIKVGRTTKRFDVVAYNTQMQPVLLVECKQIGVPIDQAVLDQALRYNLALKAPYILLSNGFHHYCFRLGIDEGIPVFEKDIPEFLYHKLT